MVGGLRIFGKAHILKICVVTSSFPINSQVSENAGGFVYDFTKLLLELGHDVTVVTPQNSEIQDIEILSFANFANVTSLAHLSTKVFFDVLRLSSVVISGSIKLLKIQKKEKFDRILCFWALPSGLINLPARYFFKTPMDTWLLGSDVWAARSYPFGIRILRIISKYSEFLFADGIGLAAENFKLTNVQPRFLASGRKTIEFEDSKQAPVSPYIVFVGRLHANKGIDLLVKAYFELLSNNPNLPNLHIYGEGPLKIDLQKLVLNSGNQTKVQFLGILTNKELPRVASQSSGFIIPSRIESIPLILGQASRYAPKILVTDVGDMGDLVKAHKAGIVCEPNVASLAICIQDLLDSDSEMYEAGRREVSETLSLEHSVRHYLDLVSTRSE